MADTRSPPYGSGGSRNAITASVSGVLIGLATTAGQRFERGGHDIRRNRWPPIVKANLTASPSWPAVAVAGVPPLCCIAFPTRFETACAGWSGSHSPWRSPPASSCQEAFDRTGHSGGRPVGCAHCVAGLHNQVCGQQSFIGGELGSSFTLF